MRLLSNAVFSYSSADFFASNVHSTVVLGLVAPWDWKMGVAEVCHIPPPAIQEGTRAEQLAVQGQGACEPQPKVVLGVKTMISA